MFCFSTYCANCFLFNGGEQCFTFQLIVAIVFCLMKVVSSVLLFNLLFQLLLFNEGGVQCFTFQLIVRIVFCLMKVVCSVLLFNLFFLLFLWRWCAVLYFSTYCANCFCLLNVASSVLLFNLLFQLFLFNGGGVQCFTFQLIVSIGFV